MLRVHFFEQPRSSKRAVVDRHDLVVAEVTETKQNTRIAADAEQADVIVSATS